MGQRRGNRGKVGWEASGQRVDAGGRSWGPRAAGVAKGAGRATPGTGPAAAARRAEAAEGRRGARSAPRQRGQRGPEKEGGRGGKKRGPGEGEAAARETGRARAARGAG